MKFRKNHIAAAKLDSMKVLRIRQLYHEEGWSQGRLSRESEALFGVSISTNQIGRIVRNEAWKAYSQVGTTESEVLHRMAVNEIRDWDAEAQASLEKLKRQAPDLFTAGVPPDQGPPPSVEDHGVVSPGLMRLEEELAKAQAPGLSPQLENELSELLKGETK